MESNLVTVIDHGAGNIRSVVGAVESLGEKARVTGDPEVIQDSRILLLPGVGSFRSAMTRIHALGIDSAIRTALESGGFILGICLGMQLLCEWSDEDGGTEGLGLVSSQVTKFERIESDISLRIPHVGFNSVTSNSSSALFTDISPDSDFYFVHSYRVASLEENSSIRTATTSHGGDFISAFEIEDRIFGVQFHPELSQGNGLQLIKNYIQVASC
jgi:imidazole glycerol phosphate synthase glutamine amidotransferase subunit